MTDLSPIPQIVTQDSPVTTTQTKPPAPVSTPAPQPQQSWPSPQETAASGAVAQTGASSGIPYQTHYDAETGRFIIEARDPKTGAVIIELPPQSAFQQIQATAAVTADSPLGRHVDKSA